METIVRKGAVLLFIFLAFSLVGTVRTDCERAVISEPEDEEVFSRDSVAHRLFRSAERWLEVRELTGTNDHQMITVSMNLCGLDGDMGYPWCASAQAEIHHVAEVEAPKSARVVDWFVRNVVWEKQFGEIPPFEKKGMVGGLYYRSLGRLGHIFLIVGEDKNNFYTMEGNTNLAGSREGDGFYKKVRSKESVAALADYCLEENLFGGKYKKYLKERI